jgi:hypothetical protein
MSLILRCLDDERKDVQMDRITGIFDGFDEAEKAVDELRELGLTENHIGILSRHPEGKEHEKAKEAGKGAAVGAGAGAVMGIAAAFIPGVGPFITAGVLTSWIGTTAGAAAAGAAVGGTAGGLAGLLSGNAEFSEEEAERYSEAVREGGVLVAVDVSGPVEEDRVLSTLIQHDAEVNVVHA